MKCIKRDQNGNVIRICCCYSRQVKGCRDDSMEIADEVTEEIIGLDWNKVTVCKGFNDESEDSRICMCLDLNCGNDKMVEIDITKDQAVEYVESMFC